MLHVTEELADIEGGAKAGNEQAKLPPPIALGDDGSDDEREPADP